jgi:hypothetical protein
MLSSISKILEKMVCNNLVHHLESNNLLYTHQYGFLPKKSTEHNLLHLTNFVAEALNEGSFAIGVFLDLKKAFDVCSHDILLTLFHTGGFLIAFKFCMVSPPYRFTVVILYPSWLINHTVLPYFLGHKLARLPYDVPLNKLR